MGFLTDKAHIVTDKMHVAYETFVQKYSRYKT